MVRGVQDTPKTTKAIAIAFDCLLEIEGELGEPIIEDNTYFEHMTWRNQAETDMEAPSMRTQVANGKKKSVVLLHCKACETHQCPFWNDNT